MDVLREAEDLVGFSRLSLRLTQRFALTPTTARPTKLDWRVSENLFPPRPSLEHNSSPFPTTCFSDCELEELVFGASGGGWRFIGAIGRWNDGGHFADHGEDKLFVVVRESGGIFFDFGEEANFLIGEFTEDFACFTILRRVAAGEKVGQADFHGFGNFRESFE